MSEADGGGDLLDVLAAVAAAVEDVDAEVLVADMDVDLFGLRQDGDLGLVTMNYDFVINDKIHHSGLEHWQVRKIDGQWKILSVTWTKYSHS